MVFECVDDCWDGLVEQVAGHFLQKGLLLRCFFVFDKLDFSADVYINFWQLLFFVLLEFLKSADHLRSEHTCFILDLRVVHISWRKTKQIENVLLLVAAQNTLDVGTDRDALFDSIAVSHFDHIFQVKLIGYFDHQLLKLWIGLNCFAIVN